LIKVTSLSTDYKPVIFISRREYLCLSPRQKAVLLHYMTAVNCFVA